MNKPGAEQCLRGPRPDCLQTDSIDCQAPGKVGAQLHEKHGLRRMPQHHEYCEKHLNITCISNLPYLICGEVAK